MFGSRWLLLISDGN